MRTQSGALRRYVPGSVPDDPKELARFMRDELAEIQYVLGAMADGQMDKTTVAPLKPRDGMVRYTDGTWNPGAGRGFYGYDNGAWKLLG